MSNRKTHSEDLSVGKNQVMGRPSRPLFLIFLLFFSPPRFAEGMDILTCLVDFSDLGPRIGYIQTLEWPDQPPVNLVLAGKEIIFDGVVGKAYVVPSVEKKPVGNAGLYLIHRDGKPHFIKIFPSATKEVEKNDARGVLLGQELGGPAVYRMGRVKMPDGRVRRYVEMEQIFPDQEGMTWKGGLQKEKGFPTFFGGNPPLYRQLVAILVRGLEHRVAPTTDLDFMVSGGRVRIFDTAEWRQYPPEDRKVSDGINFFIYKLDTPSAPHPNPFVKELKDGIEQSPVLTSEEKKRLLSIIRD
jgi:hypothetical protein